MTKTQVTTTTPVQYNSSGAAAGFGPQAHPPHEDAAAAKTIQDKTKGNSNYNGDNRAFISKLKRNSNFSSDNKSFISKLKR
tara:strand:- start:2066 stop:2308 length:243 start_codon:yes stop_codon:yes gene_type:complete